MKYEKTIIVLGRTSLWKQPPE